MTESPVYDEEIKAFIEKEKAETDRRFLPGMRILVRLVRQGSRSTTVRECR